jgi:hypothetical protein
LYWSGRRKGRVRRCSTQGYPAVIVVQIFAPVWVPRELERRELERRELDPRELDPRGLERRALERCNWIQPGRCEVSENESNVVDAGTAHENAIVTAEPRELSAANVMTPGLARRMIQATKSVEALSLDGNNEFHKYRYPTIGQVRGHANRALANAGVSIMPSVVRVGRSVRTSAQGKAMQVTAVEIDILVSSEDGSYLAHWTGESEDTGDKGVQKAVSAAVKSWLAHTLLMPVSEEEDDDGTDEHARDKSRGKRTPHWIDDPKARARFWAWTTSELGLNERDVYAALAIEHMHEYTGTMQDAKRDIENYVAAMSAYGTHQPDDKPNGEVRDAVQ